MGDPDPDPDPVGDSIRGSDDHARPVCDAYGAPDTVAERKPVAVRDANAVCDANTDANADAVCDADAGTNGHGIARG